MHFKSVLDADWSITKYQKANFSKTKMEGYGLPSDYRGYTLVWPCVSYGNIGQLTMDLIIHTGLQNKTVNRKKDHNKHENENDIFYRLKIEEL